MATATGDIRPLTFLQTYRAAHIILDSLMEKDTTTRHRIGQSRFLYRLSYLIALPLYLHFITSGYGFFVNDRNVGWIYLRGRQQLFYIDVLAVHPDYRRQGIGAQLLAYAEEIGSRLQRQAIALNVALENTPAINLYEQQGFRRGHWQVWRCESYRADDHPHSGTLRLNGVGPLRATRHYRRFAFSRKTGNGPASGDLSGSSRILEVEADALLYRWSGRGWVIREGDQVVGYLHHQKTTLHSIYYLACSAGWAQPEQVLTLLNPVPPESFDLRIASREQHQALADSLTARGFTEAPAPATLMVKPLVSKESSSA